MGPSTDI